jgi:hypothetical protein
MRLLSLYKNTLIENGSRGQFESRLEDDLTIKPRSKISLVNANVKYNIKFFTVSPQNSRFSLYLTQSNINTKTASVATLNIGNYDVTELINEIQKAINASLSITINTTDTVRGLSSKCFLDDKDLFNIQLGKVNLSSLAIVNTLNAAFTLTPSIVERTTTGDNWQSYVEFGIKDPKGSTNIAEPISKGPNTVSIKLSNVSSSKLFVFGLLTELVDPSATELPPERYAVYISNHDNNGNYNVNGFKTGIAAANNDTVTLILDKGFITFEVTSKNLPTDIPFSYRENLGINDTSFIYASFNGKDTALDYTNSKYYIDPFSGSSSLEADPSRTKVQIDFTAPLVNSDLWAVLGYSSNILNQSGLTALFTGLTSINYSVDEDSGLNIIIDNLPLVSYNFTDNVSKKQPIVAVIPSGLRDDNGVTSYNSNFLIPVAIDNMNDINVKLLRFSLRNAKDNAIERIDECMLTLAILDADE